MEECFVRELALAYAAGELLDLWLDVAQEGGRAPAADEHDSVDWFFG